jgi:DNA-binding XRE family transcriptional regulator
MPQSIRQLLRARGSYPRLEPAQWCCENTRERRMSELRTILQVAASQWTAIPSPDQILRALEAGGFKVVPIEAAPEERSLLRVLTNDKETTARRIAATRKAKGLSQEKLAETLGCHVVTVSKLETGVMDLTMEWILRIADALQVPPTRFTEDTDIIHDPKAYVQSVLVRHNLKPSTLAKNIGMSGSTFTRAFNDPGHKFLFSARTLQKIKEWDNAQ